MLARAGPKVWSHLFPHKNAREEPSSSFHRKGNDGATRVLPNTMVPLLFAIRMLVRKLADYSSRAESVEIGVLI